MSGASLFRNSAALVAGRIALSLLRMVAALCVARLAGAESFGAYALLLGIVALFEWLVDFGQTDIAVRDAARDPDRRDTLLAALSRAKRMQGLAGAAALPLILAVMGYDGPVILAGCAGSVAIGASALLQPARAALRLALRPDRDMAAELAGTAAMLPLLALASLMRAPLPVLIATFALARLAQAALAIHWAPPCRAAAPASARHLARSALPLGVAGLLVVLYDALAPLLLAHLLDLKAVAIYAAAARFIFPILIAVQAINTAFFPVIAHGWRRDPAGMERTQQAALLLSVAVSAPLFAGIHGGADFLMSLMGGDFRSGAPLLRLMAWVLLARAVTTAMSPLIVVAGRQGRAMLLTLASLAAQVVALFVLVPRLGVIGAGVGYLLVELLLGSLAVSWMGQAVSGARIDWRPVAALLAAAALAVRLVDATPLAGSFPGGVAAGTLSLGFILLLARLMRRRMAPVWRDLRRRRSLAGDGA
ncbi:lipopolysaccharide biosynthesis protein [Sphingobium cloacae]|uniref:Putative membrane protein n=1 Tax=Sphingobium cloacae TaxID=120107 RepID=A0A1E1F373_9SPHN|nr:oligosaccharide flippase family protein [Sphingobium cloacae]BAV64973.1 putative membrane protein [Sphingobium cloacae]